MREYESKGYKRVKELQERIDRENDRRKKQKNSWWPVVKLIFICFCGLYTPYILNEILHPDITASFAGPAIMLLSMAGVFLLGLHLFFED